MEITRLISQAGLFLRINVFSLTSKTRLPVHSPPLHAPWETGQFP